MVTAIGNGVDGENGFTRSNGETEFNYLLKDDLRCSGAGSKMSTTHFCVFDLLVILRVNLFLSELTGRADSQNMMRRFQASGFDSLRLFINLDYLKGAPLKIATASAIGTIMGAVGGFVGRLPNRPTIAA